MKANEIVNLEDFDVCLDQSDINTIIVLIKRKARFAKTLDHIEGYTYCHQIFSNNPHRLNQLNTLSKLIAFRDDIWDVQGWAPNLEGKRYVIHRSNTQWMFDHYYHDYGTFQFKDEETAEYFLDTHIELLNQWNGGV